MKINTAFLAAAIGAAICATPALANPQQVSRQEPVAYGDLNLASADGQAQLQQRIDRAAWKACSRVRDHRTRNLLREQNLCVREARARTAVQVARAIADDQDLGG